jgi:hypothetical protein
LLPFAFAAKAREAKVKTMVIIRNLIKLRMGLVI